MVIVKANKQTIAALVQKCLAAQGQNCHQWEHPIDALAAHLYGLPTSE